MNNYIKISQIDSLPLDSNLINNTLLTLNGLNIDNNLFNIGESIKFIHSFNMLPSDSISFTLKENINKIIFDISIPVQEDNNRIIFTSINNKNFNYKTFSNNQLISYNETITDNNFINDILISPFRSNLDKSIKETSNLIENFIVNTDNYTSINLNLPSLKNLSITNCKSLEYISLNDFNSINEILITNTNCSGNIRINSLGKNCNIDLRNNNFIFIELIGNKTILNLDNCNLYPQKNNILKYIKFKNCILDNLLIDFFESQNIQLEIE